MKYIFVTYTNQGEWVSFILNKIIQQIHVKQIYKKRKIRTSDFFKINLRNRKNQRLPQLLVVVSVTMAYSNLLRFFCYKIIKKCICSMTVSVKRTTKHKLCTFVMNTHCYHDSVKAFEVLFVWIMAHNKLIGGSGLWEEFMKS